MTDERLVEQVRAGVEQEESMEALYWRCRPMIAGIARRFCRPSETEDLIQEGFIGLCQAVERYRPEEGIPFRSYAPYWIRRAMGRYLEKGGSLIRIPAARAGLMNRYRRLADGWESSKGTPLPDEEAAAALGISAASLKSLRRDMALEEVESLDAVLGDGRETTLEGLLKGSEGPEHDVVERMTGEELKRILWACVDELENKTGRAIRYRYQRGMDSRAAGELLGEEPLQVRRLVRKGLEELRRPEKAARLRPYLDDTYNRGLRGTGVTAFRRTWTSATERTALERSEGFTDGGAGKRK